MRSSVTRCLFLAPARHRLSPNPCSLSPIPYPLSPIPYFLALLCVSYAGADDWPQWRGPLGDGVWRETGIVDTLPTHPKYRWKTAIGGGFCGPAVAGGRVYLCDRVLASGQQNPEYHWDRTDPVQGSERVLCLDAGTGRVLWKHAYPCRYEISYPSGPRATPTVDHGKVYALGAMGDLWCLDARSGKVLWSKNYIRDFGTRMNPWGMAAAPLVDGQRLIVLAGGKDHAGVLALDKDSGREMWRALDCPDPGYSAPTIVECGGTRQLLVWCPTGLYGIDPATGKVFWGQGADVTLGHSIASPIFDPVRRLVFATSFFNGPLMVELDAGKPAARLLWRGASRSEMPRRTEGLHGLMSTPVFQDGFLYGVCSYGHLRCLDPLSGRRIWETLAPTGAARWSTAFLIRHQGRLLLFNEHGDLLAARLSPRGYEESSRMHLIDPTTNMGGRKVVWCHPAFADRAVFVRNDREIVRVDLAGGR
jgi:outer membrane protein assembly factor BamB